MRIRITRALIMSIVMGVGCLMPAFYSFAESGVNNATSGDHRRPEVWILIMLMAIVATSILAYKHHRNQKQ